MILFFSSNIKDFFVNKIPKGEKRFVFIKYNLITKYNLIKYNIKEFALPYYRIPIFNIRLQLPTWAVEASK